MPQGNPFDQFDHAAPVPSAPSSGLSPLFQVPEKAPDPIDVARLNLAEQSESRQAQTENRTSGNTKFDNVSNMRKEFTTRKEVQDFQTILPQVASAMEIAKNPKATGADDLNLIYTFGKVMDPGSVVREGELALASSTGSFAQSLEGAVSKLRSGEKLPDDVRHNLVESMRRRGIEMARSYNLARGDYEKRASLNGIDPFEVVGTHPATPFQQAEADFSGHTIGNFDGSIGARPAGAAPLAPPDGVPPGLVPQEPQGAGGVAVAQGATRTVRDDAASALIDTMVRAGNSAGEIDARVLHDFPDAKFPKVDPAVVSAAQAYMKKHPDYKGSFGDAVRTEDQSLRNRIAGSGPGAAVIASADTGTFGTLPKIIAGAQTAGGVISGDPRSAGDIYDSSLQDANFNVDSVRSTHPGWALAGDTAGFLAGDGMLGAVPGIARVAGRIPGTLRPIAGDALYGAVNGVGSSDSLAEIPGNVVVKASESAGGGILGRGITKGVGAALAPTGANLKGLYAAGGRPTPGQRFADRGVIGAALNGAEEAMQSFPGLGYAVRGARQGARDQFETGAFNLALNEIGVQLPASAQHGPAAHAYMQSAFTKGYDDLLPKMRVVADSEFTKATGAIKADVAAGALSEESARRFDKIVAAQVDRRMTNGTLTGDALKDAVSGIGKRVRDILSSTQGDRELAAMLEDYSGAIRDAASRHSAPDDVARLTALDRGYAKAVRIEEASATRGGEPGRFTPTQFDRAVQKSEGGVRSRAYLRGEALLQDYAEQGKSLVDRLPNSGTADRLLLTQGLVAGPSAALAYASPMAAAGAALLTAPYLPGVRKVTQGALAPRKSKGLNTLGDLIRRNNALGGAVGASAVPYAAPSLLPANFGP